MRRSWTTAEVDCLIQMAGTFPVEDICEALGRSRESVKQKAKRMRSQGAEIDLAFTGIRLSTCPSCGCLRSTIGASGVCEPCRRREQLARIHGRISDALMALPMDVRALYAETEAETESRPEAMPRKPDTAGMDDRRRARAEEAYEIAMEEWQARSLMRQVKAAQKRSERIVKKLPKDS